MISEFQLYSFIEKYLISRDIELIQNEVNVQKQIKRVDLLAKSSDSYTYYFIEVKKSKTTEEDYYNLAYILESNNLAKHKRGILIGDFSDTKLERMIQENKRIERIDINKIFRLEFMENYKITNTNTCYNPYKKYFRNFFKYISDETLNNFSIIDDNSIYIEYIINDTVYFFYGTIEKWENIKGNLYVEKTDYFLNEKIKTLILSEINIKDLKRQIYYIKYSNIFKENEKFWEYTKSEEVTKILDILSEFLDLKKIKVKIEYQDYIKNFNEYLLRIIETDLIIIKFRGKLFLTTHFFIGFLCGRTNKDKFVILKEYIYDVKNYNEIAFFENTNLIINNIILEPIKKLEEMSGGYNRIILELKLNNEKVVSYSYRVDRIDNIKNVDFYLFYNWDIIIHFENKIKELIKNDNKLININKSVKYYKWEKLKNNYSNRKIYNEIIKENVDVETIYSEKTRYLYQDFNKE